MRISDWSSDVCSSDLLNVGGRVDNAKGDNLLLVNGKPAFGQPFDAAALDANNYIPVTVLVRTDKFIEVGGFPEVNTEAWPFPDCEDWGLWRRLRDRSEEHTSELQSLMRISYAVFCLKKKNNNKRKIE